MKSSCGSPPWSDFCGDSRCCGRAERTITVQPAVTVAQRVYVILNKNICRRGFLVRPLRYIVPWDSTPEALIRSYGNSVLTGFLVKGVTPEVSLKKRANPNDEK